MKAFPDELLVKDAGMKKGSRRFRLSGRFRYSSSHGVIEVPEGFVTDGASIPRIFWSILGPFGSYLKAAVIHDYLYSANNTTFTRKQADLIFKEAMFNDGVPWYKRDPIYMAVRVGGRRSFKGAKK